MMGDQLVDGFFIPLPDIGTTEAPTVADRCRNLIAMLRIDAAEPDDDDPVSMQ